MSAQPREHRTMVAHPGSDVTRPGFNPLQHHTHLQRAVHPRPDRVRCSFEEDRRVHTCGPEPTGGLL
jgi:hypothetical protein